MRTAYPLPVPVVVEVCLRGRGAQIMKFAETRPSRRLLLTYEIFLARTRFRRAQHPGLRDELQPTTGGNPSSEPENGFTRSTQSDCHGLKLVAG